MARAGMPLGVTADTALLLDFAHRELLDASANGNNATRFGGLRVGDGYYGRGVTFSATSYLTVAQSASLDISGDLTLDFKLRCPAFGADMIILERNSDPAGTLSWRVDVGTTGLLSLACRDSGGTLDTISTAEVLVPLRWYDARLVFDTSAYMWLILDGQVWAKQATARASLKSASLGPLYIGRNAAGTFPFTGGSIAGLRIRAAADTSLDSCSCNLSPRDRITRRDVRVADIRLKEDISTDAETADGGAFWVAATDLTALAVDSQDLISVQRATAVGDALTTLTRHGNLTDVKAATGGWFYDTVTGRSYLSEDPDNYAHVIVVVRALFAYRGFVLGGRWVRSALLNADELERRTGAWFHGQPAGGGGMVTLAAQHPDFPATWLDELTSGVLWIGSEVYVSMVSDHLPWSERAKIGRFFVEAQPEAKADTLALQLTGLYARMYRRDMEATTVTLEDYSSAPASSVGKPLKAIFGRGHLRVEAVGINKTPTSGRYAYRLTPPGFKIARINNVGAIGSDSGGLDIYDVDLDGGQFTVAIPPPGLMESVPADGIYADGVWADCDGYALTVADQTEAGPVDSHGTGTDCTDSPQGLLKALLTLYAGFSTADFGSAWTVTAALATLPRRFVGHFSAPDAAREAVAAAQHETLTHLYPAASGLLEWEGVVKADAIEHTIRDFDVLNAETFADDSQVAQRSQITAYAYRIGESGELLIGTDVKLDLKGLAKYAKQRTWFGPGGEGALTGIPTGGDALVWLENVRGFHEKRTIYERRRLSKKWMALLEIMDRVDDQIEAMPGAVAGRVRPLLWKTGRDSLQIEAVREENYPASPGETPYIGTGIQPFIHMRHGSVAGISLADTAGVWTDVPDWADIVEDFDGFFTDTTSWPHTLAIRAKRTGGSGNTDLLFRLYAVNEAAVVVTLTGGFGTSEGYDSATDFSALESMVSFASAGVDIVKLQYKTTNSATGTIYAQSWEMAEVDVPATALLPSVMIWSWWDTSGIDLAALVATDGGLLDGVAGGLIVPDMYALDSYRAYAYVATESGSGVNIELRSTLSSFGLDVLAHFDVVTAGTNLIAVTPTIGSTPEAFNAIVELDSGGTLDGTLYGMALFARQMRS
jgi:hypothetical protein